MHLSSKMFVMLLVCLVSASAVSAATIDIYTDKTEWEAAVSGSYFTEDFSDDILNDGVSYVSSEDAGINPANEWFHAVLTSFSANEPSTTWSFDTPIVAYGGTWTLGGPGGSGNSLKVYTDGSQAGTIINDTNNDFWGLVSDTPFTTVLLIGSNGTQQQIYFLDDMVYSPVPEPAGVLLMLLASLGVLGPSRNRRSP